MDASRRSLLGLAVTLCLAVSVGCGGSGGGGGGPDGGPPACIVTQVTAQANPTSVPPGQASVLTALITTANTCAGTVTWTASPSTGTIATVGTQTTFTSTTPGTYTLTAKSTDDPTKSGSVMVTVVAPSSCGTPNGTIVTHTANITASETWAGNGVTHQIPGSFQIRAPATVTIQPCAIVQLAASTEIDIIGDTTNNVPAKLLAAGTDPNTGFIVFEPLVTGQPWGFFRGVNQQSLIEMHDTLVSQGGNGNTFGGHAPIYMIGPGHFLLPAPVLKLDQVVIDRPVGSGIFLDSEAGFDPGSTAFGVKGAPDYPVQLEMMATGTIPGYGSQDNAKDEALVTGPSLNVFADLNITGNMPLYITQSFNVVPPAGSSNPLGVTLTLQPGAELRFAPRSGPTAQGIRVVFGGTGNPGQNPVGRLVALGTAQAPIRFTSGAPNPTAGDWAGLQLLTATGSEMTYNIIEYAGAPGGYVSANCRPSGSSDAAALTIGSSDFVPPSGMLASSTIQFSAGHGIDAVWAAGIPNDPDLTGGNTFTSIGGCKQTYNALTTGSCPSGGGCTAQ